MKYFINELYEKRESVLRTKHNMNKKIMNRIDIVKAKGHTFWYISRIIVQSPWSSAFSHVWSGLYKLSCRHSAQTRHRGETLSIRRSILNAKLIEIPWARTNWFAVICALPSAPPILPVPPARAVFALLAMMCMFLYTSREVNLHKISFCVQYRSQIFSIQCAHFSIP